MRKEHLAWETVALLCFLHFPVWLVSWSHLPNRRQTPALCLLSSAGLSLRWSGGHQAAFPPTSWPQTGTSARYTRGQHPSSHLEDEDWSPWLNEQHKHNSMLRKQCPSSSLPSGVRPADRCSAVGQENMWCVFRSGTNMGAITHRTEEKRAALYLPDTIQEK